MPAAPPRLKRSVSYSAVNDQVHMVFPNDLNANDTVFGGLVMATMDRIAVVVAGRHSGGVCVTAGIDGMHFIAPARRGDILIYNVSVNRSWTSSMEIGCKVEAERVGGGDRRHILSAYLTFVAMDAHEKPQAVPELVPETTDERRRYDEAALRRNSRLTHADDVRKLRAKYGAPEEEA